MIKHLNLSPIHCTISTSSISATDCTKLFAHRRHRTMTRRRSNTTSDQFHPRRNLACVRHIPQFIDQLINVGLVITLTDSASTSPRCYHDFITEDSNFLRPGINPAKAPLSETQGKLLSSSAKSTA